MINRNVVKDDLCIVCVYSCRSSELPAPPYASGAALFASGAALFAVGIHLSYLNVAPQQARTKARNDFVKERLRQKQSK
ncbi:hypothetical protein N665_0043s0016 [Sinapis alba]|nr:hypothetical protein N665_0043s0016 [Sinapis alba]